MVTIAHVTAKYIEERPFLQEALVRGIINYGALADTVLPQIQRELKKEVKHAAVMMALRRLAEKLEQKFSGEKTIKGSLINLAVQSNLFEMTVLKTPETLACIKGLYGIADFNKGDMLTVTQGSHEITLIANKQLAGRIEKIFEKQGSRIKKKIRNVASLTVKIPPEAIDIPGFYYTILRALAWNNVNLVEVVSTFTELILIMYEEDVMRGYTVLQELVRKE